MSRYFHRIFGCFGISIPLPGPWQFELWFCPPGSLIPMHVHPHIDSRLIFLGGTMWWSNAGRGRRFSWRDIGRVIPVPRDSPHGAYAYRPFGLFANLERWFGPKTSAAIDLEHTD